MVPDDVRVETESTDEAPGFRAREVSLVYSAEHVALKSLDLHACLRLLLSQDRAGVQGLRPAIFSTAEVLVALVQADVEHRNCVYTDDWLRQKIAAILDEVNDLVRTLSDRRVTEFHDDGVWGHNMTRLLGSFLSPYAVVPTA